MEFNRKNVITFILVIVFSILFILIGNKTNKISIIDESNQECYKARVIKIENKDVQITQLTETSTHQVTTLEFKAKLLTGPNKGKTVEVEQTIDSAYAAQQKEVKKDDKIIVYHEAETEENNEKYFFAETYRSDVLAFMVILFLGLIIILGRSKGFFTILSLIITVLTIFCVFIPAIINGRNVYATTIVISIFIILMTLLLINGWNKKTLCAILGNIGGIAVAGILAIVLSKLLKITGVINEEYAFIITAQLKYPLDLIGLVWSGIVIGSLGAVMDVAMSISSAMNELSENMENKSFKKMLKSGMNIGRDAIGTMTNTLILAYVGTSLVTVLLLTMYGKNLLYLFNMEMIVVQVLQSIVGSLGILFAVPATAIFAANIFTKKDDTYVYKKRDGIGGIKI